MGIAAFIIAALTMFGIEGVMIVVGMQRGLALNQNDVSKERGIASFILLTVSIAAGLYQRTFLINIPEVSNVVGFILMVVSGIGVPTAILLIAPYLGVILNFQLHADAEWLKLAREEFEKSNVAALAQRELQMKLDALNRQEKREIKSERQQSQNSRPAEPHQESHGNVVKLPGSGEILDWYLQQSGMTLRDDIKAKQVAETWANSVNYRFFNGDLERLSTAIRVNLARRRKERES